MGQNRSTPWPGTSTVTGRAAELGVTLEPQPPCRHVYADDAGLRAHLGYHFTMHTPELDEAGTDAAGTARLYAGWRTHQPGGGSLLPLPPTGLHRAPSIAEIRTAIGLLREHV